MKLAYLKELEKDLFKEPSSEFNGKFLTEEQRFLSQFRNLDHSPEVAEGSKKRNHQTLAKQPQEAPQSEESTNFEDVDQLISKYKEEEEKRETEEKRIKEEQVKFNYLKTQKDMNQVLMGSDNKTNKDVDNIIEQDGSVLFYYLDIFDDQYFKKGKVFLLGKVFNKKTQNFESCTVVIENNYREIYFVPNGRGSPEVSATPVSL